MTSNAAVAVPAVGPVLPPRWARLAALGLWCTSVHVITFALFALVVLTMPGRPAGTPEG
jgi:hypothetical protein